MPFYNKSIKSFDLKYPVFLQEHFPQTYILIAEKLQDTTGAKFEIVNLIRLSVAIKHFNTYNHIVKYLNGIRN